MSDYSSVAIGARAHRSGTSDVMWRSILIASIVFVFRGAGEVLVDPAGQT